MRALLALFLCNCAAAPAVIPALAGAAISSASAAQEVKRELAEAENPKEPRRRRGAVKPRTDREEAIRLCRAKQNAAQAAHVDGRKHWIECGPNGEVTEFVE
jgi:hypothetical protein